ncbi:MAG: dual specificity protein phosphatase family protein [Egibacteraceae bacterium]
MSNGACRAGEPTRVRLRLAEPAGVPVVLGETDALSAGQPHRGLPLRERRPGVWEAEVALPAGVGYRLALLDPATGARVDDEGFARWARPSALPREPDGRRLLEQAWRATLLRLVVAHRLPAGWHLAVVGDGPALGRWRDPLPLEPVDGDGRGRWEAVVAIGEPYGEIAYRYVVLGERAHWEREPNRHVVVPPAGEVANGLVATDDANVVTGLGLDWVTDEIALGPYPQGRADADRLAEAGVTAVLSVQTDADLERRDLDVATLERTLRQVGLAFARVPIVDFDAADLAARLPEATARLEGLLAQGHRVYVHCTAGMGRSPAVVVAHLAGRGATLGQAARLVRERHPDSAPNLDAIARACGGQRRR